MIRYTATGEKEMACDHGNAIGNCNPCAHYMMPADDVCYPPARQCVDCGGSLWGDYCGCKEGT